MDDLFFVLLGLAIAGVVLATPILTLIALVRGASLRRRVEGLERELRALRGGSPEVAGPFAGAPPQPSRAATPPAPAPEPRVAPSPPPARAPEAPPAPRAPFPAPVPAPVRATAPAAASAGGPFAPAPPPRPAAPPRPPLWKRVNLEQWAGVRGAAVLGGSVLALAAILFVKLAFENQWIGLQARCWLGAAFGLVAIGAGAFFRKRAYRVLPDALEGAGIVALFAAVWAAHRVFGFLSLAAALPLLAAVAALACFLALRHRSQLTAVLGLLGGFAAAFLLSERGEHPFGLFGYLLLLDLGLLFVGRRSGWPLLGALALLGTFFFEGLYVLRDLDEEHLLFALGVLAAFALLFALSGGMVRAAASKAGRAWVASQAGAVLLPLAFAVHFAGKTDFEAQIGSVAGLVAILSVAACVLSKAQRTPWLAAGAAAGGLAVIGVWTMQAEAAESAPGTLVALVAGITLIFHAFAERDARLARAPDAETGGRGRAAGLAAAGGALIVALSPLAGGHTSPWLWTLGLAVPAAALVRQGAFPGRAWLPLAAGLIAGLGAFVHGTALVPNVHATPAPPPAFVLLAFLTLGGAGFLAGGALLSGRARMSARHAAGLFLVPGLLGLVRTASRLSDSAFPVSEPGFLLGLLLPLALLALAAGLLGSFVWTGAGPLALFIVLFPYCLDLSSQREPSVAALVALAAGAMFFGAAPLFSAAARAKRLVWIAAALALPTVYLLVHVIYVERFSEKADCTPLLGAALLSGGLWLGAVRRLAGAPAFRTARGWYSAATALFLAMALPVQLDFEWFRVSVALWALGLALLARRQGSAWLARAAAAAALAATVFLVFAALDTYHYLREGTPVFSWIGYAHLVPIAALLASAWLLRSRRPPHEAAAAGLGAVVLGFVFINITILDFFSAPDTMLAFSAEHHQARDLTTSISWAVYALLLLAAGTALKQSALRWSSLLLFLLTIAKAFLYDLGELEGMSRVASLGGLAIALLAVSLLYQRFVFRRPAVAAPDAGV